MKTEEEGSLTIFSALSLLLILSFLLALLEGARVSGLQMMDTLAADTGMDCVAAEYQTVLWINIIYCIWMVHMVGISLMRIK